MEEIYGMGQELQAMKRALEKRNIIVSGDDTFDASVEMNRLRGEMKDAVHSMRQNDEAIESLNNLRSAFDDLTRRRELDKEEINNLRDTIEKLSVKPVVVTESISSSVIDELTKRIDQMALDLNALTLEVTRVQTVQASAVTLLKSLTDELQKIHDQLDAQSKLVPPEIDTAPLNDLIGKLKDSTDALAGAVSASSNVVPTKTVILNADDPTKPTIAVVAPEVLPPVVTATPEVVVDKVDPTSPEPQVVVTVAPSTDAVVTSTPVVTDVIKTEPGLTDVVVATPADVHADTVATTGVDPVAAVVDAVAKTPEIVAAPAVDPVPAPAADPAPAAPVEAPVAAPVAADPAPAAPVADAPVASVADAPAAPVADAAPAAPAADAPVAPAADPAPVADAAPAAPVADAPVPEQPKQ